MIGRRRVPADGALLPFVGQRREEERPQGREESMISKAEARDLITDLFEEEALVIGGLVAVHKVDDDLIWRLVKSLDVIRSKILRRLEDEALSDEPESQLQESSLKPHPAIEDFLLSLRRS